MASCLLVADGSGASGLGGESNAAAAADSSSFLFSVGLGASLMKVDWRTSAGFSGSAFCFSGSAFCLSGSAFCFLGAVETLTLDADSLLGMPPPLLAAALGLAGLEAEDEDDEALPGDAVRGV